MDIVKAVRAVLIVDETVIGIVSNRIWSHWPRTDDSPCVFIEVDSSEEQNYLDTGASDGVISSIVVTARSESEVTTESLRDAIKSCLAGYSGTFEAVLESAAMAATPKEEGSTAHWYDCVLDFSILWSE